MSGPCGSGNWPSKNSLQYSAQAGAQSYSFISGNKCALMQ
jgi:hypothetical protein